MLESRSVPTGPPSRRSGIARTTPSAAWPGLAALVLLVASACSGRHAPTPGRPVEAGHTQTGLASWYGPGFHGKPTASGERYDQHGLTAAHKTLPLGTVVDVTHLANGRSVRVRINDRGPFVGKRIIDLSRGAAEAIGMIGEGVARVRLEVVGEARKAASRRRAGDTVSGSWVVQAGSFRDRDRALDLRLRLERHFAPVRVTDGGDGWHRVILGPYDDQEEAETVRRRLLRDGLVDDARVRADPRSSGDATVP